MKFCISIVFVVVWSLLSQHLKLNIHFNGPKNFICFTVTIFLIMLEGVYGCFMPCNIFLAGNSEVSLELQCFTTELITYIVCECDAPE